MVEEGQTHKLHHFKVQAIENVFMKCIRMLNIEWKVKLHQARDYNKKKIQLLIVKLISAQLNYSIALYLFTSLYPSRQYIK